MSTPVQCPIQGTTQSLCMYKKAFTCEAENQNLKNGVFWDVMPCGFCKNRRFGFYKSRMA
jgi:hypothetical protein